MRAYSFVLVTVTAALGTLAACGENKPPAVSPTVTATAPAGSVSASVPVDTGPTTTTTQSLAAQAAAAGMKLVPADAGTPSHQSEPGRSIADIAAIIAAHRDEARACYDKALAAHPNMIGNVDVRWTIDPAGVVSQADIDPNRSDIMEPAVGTCIIAIIKKIHFNASAKRFETQAHYPFNFHPHPPKPGAAPDAG